jgi:hypothetical protein
MNTSHHKATPRDFFLYLGMIAALYASAISLLTIKFQAINQLFPDVLEYISGANLGSLRVGISALAVAFPIYIILSRLVYRDLASDPGKKEFWIRRWLIYFTLFLSGVTLAILGIVLINTYLQGEFTARFLLKVLSVAVVAAAIFRYYLFDLKRDVVATSGVARKLSFVAIAVVATALVAGVVIAGTPPQQRLVRLDEQRVSDLQNVQNQILYIYDRDGRLPTRLADTADSSGRNLDQIVDPESGAAYEYRAISPASFELCATFSAKTDPNSRGRHYYEPITYPLYTGDDFYVEGSWEHDAGRQCFERVIRPNPANENTGGVPKPTPIR